MGNLMTKAGFLGILALTVLAIGLSLSRRAAAVVFDDFNVSEFHFGYAPSFSGSSTSVTTASTAVRIEDEALALEGVGFQQIVLIHNEADTVNFRSRHISGGNPGPTPPGTPVYGSANAANQIGNAGFLFDTTSGTDGWIGYYVRTTATGWVTSINLDGPGIGTSPPLVPGTLIADMDAGLSKPLIADGEWHLYEWDLDANEGEHSWGAVPGIGGGHGGGLIDTTHSIDSIWFRNLESNFADATIDLDFVALNPNGSVADLLEAPAEDADFDDDTDVDDVDFAAWQTGFGLDTGATHAGGDANADGAVDGRDFLIWERQFNDAVPPIGAIPEPAALALGALALLALTAHARRSPSFAKHC
jgi:hypothetical protein